MYFITIKSKLISGCHLQDRLARRQLYDRYKNPINTLVYRITGAFDNASNVLHDVFSDVFRHQDQFRAEAFMAVWIKRLELWSVKEKITSFSDSLFMGKHILVFCLLLSISPAYSQDSSEVKFSEEPDILTRQRFIDRYENVFMTNVPTRHMLKLGLSQYYQAIPYALSDDKTLNNLSLHLGYEIKFLPAFSLALSSHFPLYSVKTPVKESLQSIVRCNRKVFAGERLLPIGQLAAP
ncbi:RNA polymerase sigma factor [Dyadobacter sandarakinus]|uniref:Uncharacterized protein n=1 Tax=Dyadobacter sandarakinus TaxID=2747268 RepID=A0ABX7I6K0_9BACT|nr:hypothetical protein [Dyadobacter sandarakinus]QRR00813.1 hypothetical protein HWI92_07775 [Dyadobacter sandarakinus]